MVRFKTMAVAVLVAALAAGSALAQGQRTGGPGREGRGGGPFAGLPLASLNLTQAQQDQIQSIRERSRAEMEALLERTRNEVLGVLTPEQQAQVKKLQAEQGDRPERRGVRRGQPQQ